MSFSCNPKACCCHSCRQERKRAVSQEQAHRRKKGQADPRTVSIDERCHSKDFTMVDFSAPFIPNDRLGFAARIFRYVSCAFTHEASGACFFEVGQAGLNHVLRQAGPLSDKRRELKSVRVPAAINRSVNDLLIGEFHPQSLSLLFVPSSVLM